MASKDTFSPNQRNQPSKYLKIPIAPMSPLNRRLSVSSTKSQRSISDPVTKSKHNSFKKRQSFLSKVDSKILSLNRKSTITFHESEPQKFERNNRELNKINQQKVDKIVYLIKAQIEKEIKDIDFIEQDRCHLPNKYTIDRFGKCYWQDLN